MAGISFFAEKNFLGSMVRGKQIADFLGGQYNPVSVYIKPRTLDHVRDGQYVDVSDGEYVVPLLQKRPRIRVIAHSLRSYEYLKTKLSNQITLLPQQHLNWERGRRERRGVTRCGYIGQHSKEADAIYKEIADTLQGAGLEFEFFSDYFTREDAASFFKRIDLLIIGAWGGDGLFKTPAKLINAASFGIPTIAYPLEGYKEFEGFYVPFSIDTLLDEVGRFKDEEYYRSFAEKIMLKAEEYHISNIAAKYACLTQR